MSNELSDTEINHILKKYRRFKGCYFKDKLPEKIEERCYYIVNLQHSQDGNGTHWCLLYCIHPNYVLWLDPYGFPPPEEIENRFKYIYYNHKEIQDYDSTACGYFCIAFIKFSYNMSNVKNALKTFDDIFSKNTNRNDKILCDMLNGFLNMDLTIEF